MTRASCTSSSSTRSTSSAAPAAASPTAESVSPLTPLSPPLRRSHYIKLYTLPSPISVIAFLVPYSLTPLLAPLSRSTRHHSTAVRHHFISTAVSLLRSFSILLNHLHIASAEPGAGHPGGRAACGDAALARPVPPRLSLRAGERERERETPCVARLFRTVARLFRTVPCVARLFRTLAPCRSAPSPHPTPRPRPGPPL